MSEASGALGGAGNDGQQQGGDGVQQQGGDAGQQQGADGQQQGGGVPAWMETLPADSPFRQNQDLLRLGSVEDVAKAYANTRAWAKDRIAIPTDDAGWNELGQKLRPENADGYKIDVPDGQDPTMANEFRKFAFDSGIPARYADATAQFFNQQSEAALSKLGSDNEAAVEALKVQYGPAGWAQRVEATNKMLAAVGIEADVADALAQVVSRDADGKPIAGAGKAVAALFKLAEATGELGKVDSTSVNLRLGTMSGAGAKAEIDRRSGDMSAEGRRWMAEAAKPGTSESKTWNDLNMAMARAQSGGA